MRKQLERLLLTILIGMSVLLGLTFWLNTNFGFNLFSAEHWQELAILQASGENIDKNFYISIGIALLIFIICLNIIYRPHTKKITNTNADKPAPNLAQPTQNISSESNKPATLAIDEQKKIEQPATQKTIIETQTLEKSDAHEPKITESTQQPTQTPPIGVNMSRPPRLNLPKNAAEIAAMQYNNQQQSAPSQSNNYDDELEKIFTENLFLVKKNPTISGFTPNLFAIGANEIVWIGGVDCDIEKLNKATERLESTFTETLDDITITVNAFLIDTMGKYGSDEHVKIFHSIEELKKYVSENHGDEITDYDREDFDAYSEYIDTVLTLLYKT